MDKPLILITNDDGVTAPGIRHLIKLMRTIGDVVVVAPDKPQSGMSHAVTISSPLRVNQLKEELFYKEFSCNGTPVDCVKLGQKVVMSRNPDLIVSGINHGSNASVNVLYSGTMAAVLEGAMENIPSVGFSLDDYSINADFTHVDSYILSICNNILQHGMPSYLCLNVNFPAKQSEPIRGVKVVRQAQAFWDEEFEERADPRNRKYYWLTGKFVNVDKGEDNDEWSIAHNYVSVVPIQFDLTAYQAIEQLSKWTF
ncbi:MAG: 5'/3'-nucleotidase SurE [Bacteroidetes bacterium]|nr:5'/3'-nucleotidase SurE [Bacteroidota bacterium]